MRPESLFRGLAPFGRYGIAVAASVVSILLRAALDPMLGDRTPYLLYPTVMGVTAFGGLGPGLLTVALCVGAAAWRWLPPAGVAVGTAADQIGLLIFVSASLLLLAVVTRQRRARARASEAVAARGKAEELLRVVTDASPVFITYIGRDQRCRFINRKYAERFGLSVGEIVGESVEEILGPEAYERVRERLQAALRGEELAYEVSLPYPRVGERHLSMAYHPRPGAGRLGQGCGGDHPRHH